MADCMECAHSNVCRALDNGDDYIKEDCAEYLEFSDTTKIAYLCKEHGEGNTCPQDGSSCSYNMCKHTTDVKHAKNFVQVDDDKYAEIDEQKRWTPCSERLPEEQGQYYVSGGNKVWICDFLIFSNFKGGWCNDVSNPIVEAWMPLPEPYKGGETDEK